MILRTKIKGIEIMVDDDFDTSIFDTHFLSVCGSRVKYATLVNRSNLSQTLLHRHIMSPGDGMVVDHVNHNGLDNRVSNLRVCTPEENGKNRKLYKNSKSGYKGVKWHTQNGYWVAQIGSKPRVHLGVFDSKHDAAIAYDIAALQVYGEYGYLNIIK